MGLTHAVATGSVMMFSRKRADRRSDLRACNGVDVGRAHVITTHGRGESPRGASWHLRTPSIANKGFVMEKVIHSEENRLLSVKETAHRLGVSRRTLERQVANGAFPGPLKVGCKSLFFVADVEAYFAKLRAQRAPA